MCRIDLSAAVTTFVTRKVRERFLLGVEAEPLLFWQSVFGALPLDERGVLGKSGVLLLST